MSIYQCFNQIFTAHAQKLLLLRFRKKFRHWS